MNLPVRRKMLSTSPSGLRTILWLLRCFSMAKPNLAFSLVHEGSLVWRKCTAHALTSAVQEALGYKLAVLLHQMYWKGSYHDSDLPSEEEVCEDVEIEMDILVPKKGSSISEFCSTQTVEGIVLNEYLIINGRPVKHKKVEKMMTSCIGKGLSSDFPNRKKPPWVLRLNVPTHQLDVNLESDKTKVLLRCEEVILHTLEERIITYYGIEAASVDPSSQPLEGKQRKKKLAVPKESIEDQSTSSPDSSLHIGSSSGNINYSNSESDQNLLSHPPPSKQARIEVEELGGGSGSDYLNLGNVDPSKNNQPFLSLEPFEISDSQIPNVESPENLEDIENVLDVSTLKLCSKELGLGSFRIEVFRKPEDIPEVQGIPGNGGSVMNEILDFDSTESRNEIEDIIKENIINDCTEMGIVDKDVIQETENSIKNNENEVELDLEAWSRGKMSVTGVPIEDPVKILQSEPNHQLPSKSESDPKLIANKHVSTAPFKVEKKVALDEKLSADQSSSGSSEHTPHKSFVASPLPNACSQLGRRDMRGFDCFAAKTRPKIIAEQPGILFTNVASELAKRWEELADEERDEFRKEGIAKAAARHKPPNSELLIESSLPKKTAQKLPVILNDKAKQETLLKKVVKEKQETQCVPVIGRTQKVSFNEIQQKLKKREEAAPEKQQGRLADERVFLIGQLKPSGMWVYRQGKDVGILRHFALQELVVYQKLMDSLALPLLPLAVPIVFDERAIGSELWKKLLSLESHYDVIKQQTLVTSELIVKNGFQISVLEGDGENDSSALITEVASVISTYGLDDLKEVLQIIESADEKLSKCRTLQISSYIESEAIRMCRQSSPVLPRHDVLALLKQWNGRPKCLHSQPVLIPFDAIAQPSVIFN
ncbi:PMS1 protein homolog 1-like isoform X2 [Hetaerina americana]